VNWMGRVARDVWKSRGFGAVFRRVEEPEPRLWCGSLNSSWSVPPQCEYGNESPLRAGFSNIKTELNVDWLRFR
jgi:hypothetical protein